MSRPFRRLRQFFRELKRRNVYQVAATYAVVGFILIRIGIPSGFLTISCLRGRCADQLQIYVERRGFARQG